MPSYSEPVLLSDSGSTRATAYQMGNKMLSLDGKTHVVWLDAVAEIRGKTYDQQNATWSETYHLGTGCDNHANPVLTADANGHLHLIYGPHGWWGDWNMGRFIHKVSSHANSLDGWTNEDPHIGYNATYASMFHGPDGLDCLVYRGGQSPNSFMFQKQRANGGWTNAVPLMEQDITPQYTHWSANIVAAPDGTLYAAGHFYNMNTDARSPGTGALKSDDGGRTWKTLSGQSVTTPVVLHDEIAIPHDCPPDSDIRLEGLAIDPQNRIWASTSGGGCAYVHQWIDDGWKSFDVGASQPNDRVARAGPMTFDTSGNLHVVCMLALASDDPTWFGHGSLEVFHVVSKDAGDSFECNQLSKTSDTASWLPSISRTGLYHPVEKPTILYTHGGKGEGCSPPDETEVFFVRIEDL